MSSPLKVSIIINTDARVDSLRTTLESLRYLEYEAFEVCVVSGPTADGTKEFLEQWGRGKVADCARRNLSESRNIGLAMAAGDIVAFLDDDSIPEPEWLDKVLKPFADPKVAASGGFLLDHTGVSYQWKFGTANRKGHADESWTRAAPELNFPFTANFPHVMANSAFRLSAVMDVGGFDEQYIYYLDETDLICRLVDKGYQIAQLEGAPVHHKFMPSHIRNSARVTTSWEVIVRSGIYFALVNAQGHHDIWDAIAATKKTVDVLRDSLEYHINAGNAPAHLRKKFERDCDVGLREGLTAGMAHNRIFYDPAKLAKFASPFHRFEITKPKPGAKRRCFCLLTRTYPPASIGGIGRYVHQLARSMALAGYQIHVLTEGETDTVDFEDGVWVHRMSRKDHVLPSEAVELAIPQHIWDYSATLLAEAKRISHERTIDAVLAPIWDCEGVAFLLNHRWPVVTSLHTTLQFYLDSHPHLKDDEEFMRDFARPMLNLERLMLTESDAVVANSQTIVREIESAYAMNLRALRLGFVPHGQEDWSKLPAKTCPALPEGGVRVLFVGRLEERKGIDVFLEALIQVLPERPHLYVDIVGNDTQKGPEGLTFRQTWDAAHSDDDYAPRVHFHGEVDDETLRGFYGAADIFVAPSRFESFGLILLEAMSFGKPLIACRAGGMPEVVRENVTGLLAEPGDARTLATELCRLVDDTGLRARMGAAARADYEARFTPTRMTEEMIAFLEQVIERPSKAIAGTAS